ncbi:phospholipid-binding domain family protein [Mizugakiibacter sediminis]|uniref:Outer membrane lipoprotein n=2 Tax=Mizugakiibacter sediminis TaxID=1475481 RepID=A0A0K8QR88_9GAMM|nr:phospholipid-binding domain family protein [Mizugakiibacter sediminis]
MRRMPALALSVLLPFLFAGCAAVVVGGAAAGAGAVHDRRDFGTVMSDRNLQLSAMSAINEDKELALQNDVSVVVFNGVMLLVGEARTPELKARAVRLASGFEGTRKLVDEIEVMEPIGFWARRGDNALTARVKAALLDITSLPGFDPTRVNVTTAHRAVYLMGLVSHTEADAIVEVARNVAGVDKVVKVFEYTD